MTMTDSNPAQPAPARTAADTAPLATALTVLANEYGGGDVVLRAARLLFRQRGKVGANHPDTSKEAAGLEFGGQRFRVLRALAVCDFPGYADIRCRLIFARFMLVSF